MAKKARKPRAAKKPRKTSGMFAPDNGVPPGATVAAANRPMEPGGGPPGSGAGPRHAADDEGTEDEDYFRQDITRTPASPPEDEEDALEQGPPYSGMSGGAVGGTPAQGRAVGGHVGHPINYSPPRGGDSTVGANPKPSRKRKK
jgi:hypothetical protein